MKKFLILTIIILLGAIGYMLLSNSSKSPIETPVKESPPIFNPPEIIQLLPILGREEKKVIFEESKYLKIEANYPSFKDTEKSAFIKRVVQDQINTFKEESGIDNISNSDKDFIFQNGAKYEFVSTYKIYETENTASVVFSFYTYTGGAHGGLVLRSLNFDRSDEVLSIGSIFKPGSNYLGELSNLSRNKLNANLKEEIGDWSNDGTRPISTNFETFYLTPGKLNIVFQPYQVAPWVAGAPEISIDIKNELGDYISPVFLNE